MTLPLIVPAIAAGWMLAFTLSLDDLVIASFTTGPGSETLPIRIYSEVRLGVKPEINAICTLVIGLIAVVIVVASLASKLSSSRGEKRGTVVIHLVGWVERSETHHRERRWNDGYRFAQPILRFSYSFTTSPRPRSARRPCSGGTRSRSRPAAAHR